MMIFTVSKPKSRFRWKIDKMISLQNTPYKKRIRAFIVILFSLWSACSLAQTDESGLGLFHSTGHLAGMPTPLIFLLLILLTYISEDLTCVIAGLLVARGEVSFSTAVSACIIGIFTGDILLVLTGRLLNEHTLHRFPFRLLIKPGSLRAAQEWFKQRGAMVILISRFVPGSRLPTYLAVGFLRMKLNTFLVFFLLATAIWTPILVGLSAQLGQQVIPLIERYNHDVPWIFALVVLLGFVIVKVLEPSLSHEGRRMLHSRWRRFRASEFWSPWIFYTPLIPWIAWLGIKYRSLSVCTAANPFLSDGGFIGESKSEILRCLDPEDSATLPFCLLQDSPDAAQRLRLFEAFQKENDLDYPLVLKPDRGQRGAGVYIARNSAAAFDYLCGMRCDVLAQAYAPGLEFGVFYIRHPKDTKGFIFSLTRKQMIHITGNGKHTLRRLILDHPRAVCSYKLHFQRWAEHLYEIPAKGEIIRLTELGTHCRGSLFLNGSDCITEALRDRIQTISDAIPHFHFGRFDLKAPDEKALREGRDLKIIELNGLTSEATHIYDPSISFFESHRVLREQWSRAFQIGATNRDLGFPVMNIRELMQRVRAFRPPELETENQ